MKYILSLDEGTTSARAIIFGESGEILSTAQKEFTQFYPKAGWVEHDAEEIFNCQTEVARKAISELGISAGDITAIGITNQRETVVVWDKFTGKPICPAVVWQCRRTSDFCDRLKNDGMEDFFREKTGLLIDPYFSGTKLKWILDNVPYARHRAEKGELLFGTIDSWLVWKLTGGKSHITDFSNASRTMLFNIHTLCWDKEILKLFDIPESMLPEVTDSSGQLAVCHKNVFGSKIPICAIAGDQQSALFGQCCFEKGNVKNTYGTGGFMLMNTGDKASESKNGLVTTIAWGIDGRITYALEGSVFVAGALIQWLRDELGLVKTAAETESIARSVPDSNGVYIVPAFTGLGAPYWDHNARGAILGITRGANKANIIRAALEAIAYQTTDVLKAMEQDCEVELKEIKADGGASENNFLMEFQADILNCVVSRPKCVETTAMGAAFLAGLGAGVWRSADELKKINEPVISFEPKITESCRERLLCGWHKAVSKTMERD